MNIYMLKKEIKYLLKNTIFYLGIIIVICTLVLTLKPYLNLYENVREENSKIVYGDEGIINGYIPTEANEQREQAFNRIYESLIEDFDVSEEEATDALNKIKKMHTQEEIAEYLHENYGISERGVDNVFESYMEKHATKKELKEYLRETFSKSTFPESFSFKYIDYLGIGLIYLSIITFVLIFMRDMKKDIFSLLHTKPISGVSYIMTKLLAGLIPICVFALIMTGIFDGIANMVAPQYGSEMEWVSIWVKLVLFILPNIFMIGVFFIFITVIFKSILPTIPMLLVYATYSNMGRITEVGYKYIPNPLSIVVRFPNDLGNNYIPTWTIINQSILIILAICLLGISIKLWKRRRII